MVIDGNSIVNRSFYGVRPLTTRDGLYTNAVYGSGICWASSSGIPLRWALYPSYSRWRKVGSRRSKGPERDCILSETWYNLT